MKLVLLLAVGAAGHGMLTFPASRVGGNIHDAASDGDMDMQTFNNARSPPPFSLSTYLCPKLRLNRSRGRGRVSSATLSTGFECCRVMSIGSFTCAWRVRRRSELSLFPPF